MEILVKVLDVGELVEKPWTNSKGENVKIASVEITLTNGLDVIVAEANDDLARSIVTQISEREFDLCALYLARLQFNVRTSKEKKIKFNSIKILKLNML